MDLTITMIKLPSKKVVEMVNGHEELYAQAKMFME
jgi:hypothetical protein